MICEWLRGELCFANNDGGEYCGNIKPHRWNEECDRGWRCGKARKMVKYIEFHESYQIEDIDERLWVI